MILGIGTGVNFVVGFFVAAGAETWVFFVFDVFGAVAVLPVPLPDPPDEVFDEGGV